MCHSYGRTYAPYASSPSCRVSMPLVIVIVNIVIVIVVREVACGLLRARMSHSYSIVIVIVIVIAIRPSGARMPQAWPPATLLEAHWPRGGPRGGATKSPLPQPSSETAPRFMSWKRSPVLSRLQRGCSRM